MSCLFNSISYLLQNEFSKVGIHNLRYFMIYYIYNNFNEKINNDMTIQDWLNNASLEKYGNHNNERYLKEMYNDSTWGGGFEIAIISHIFRLIIVVVKDNKDILTFNNCIYKEPYYKVYLDYNGSHYEPIKIEKIIEEK